MKLLLFLVFCLPFAEASSQTFGFKMNGILSSDTSGTGSVDDEARIGMLKKYMETRGLQSGTVSLSQDNMPCIVPNTKLMKAMPNVWKGDSVNKKVPGAIPNPGRRLQPLVIPIKQSAQGSQND